MDKQKADMIQIVVAIIAVVVIIVGVSWAVVWRATERDRADTRMQTEIECYISSAWWVGSTYSYEVTCKLPQEGE